MAGHGGVLPAGEALRYAEYSPPQAKRSDTDIDRGLVSLLALPPSSRSKPREPAGYRSPEPLLVPASLLCTPNPPNGSPRCSFTTFVPSIIHSALLLLCARR